MLADEVMGGNLSITRHQEEASAPASPFDNVDDHNLSLTDEERLLIDSTWKQLSNNSDADVEEELGVRIFVRIFELNPVIMDAFPNFAGLLGDREAMRRNVIFRCHGRRFVRAVRSVVDNLDALGVSAVPTLDLLGRKHRNYHGFRTDYLNTYAAAIEDVWKESLGRKFDKTTRRAWRKVIKLITSTVGGGYQSCPAAQQPVAAVNGSAKSCNNSQTDAVQCS